MSLKRDRESERGIYFYGKTRKRDIHVCRPVEGTNAAIIIKITILIVTVLAFTAVLMMLTMMMMMATIIVIKISTLGIVIILLTSIIIFIMNIIVIVSSASELLHLKMSTTRVLKLN